MNGSYTFFGAVRYDNEVYPVKLKVLEYNASEGQLPQNISEYFSANKEIKHYNKLYDSKVLEIEKIDIKKEPNGSAKGSQQNADGKLHPLGSSEIRRKDLIDLVKGDAVKYIPKPESKLTNRGKSRKASMEDWEKAEKLSFQGVSDTEIEKETGLVREGWAKMIKSLYDYAAETGKSATVPEYKISSTAAKVEDVKTWAQVW